MEMALGLASPCQTYPLDLEWQRPTCFFILHYKLHSCYFKWHQLLLRCLVAIGCFVMCVVLDLLNNHT
jgi:hypothetical protein